HAVLDHDGEPGLAGLPDRVEFRRRRDHRRGARNRRDSQMVRARRSEHGPVSGFAETMYDFVIVGGGTAGCVLASRLTEDGRTTVLLLEAGAARSPKEIGIPAAWPKLLRSAQDWRYRSEVQRHLGGRRLFVPRGKTLGGCSATNVQMYVRGHRADYDAWARL